MPLRQLLAAALAAFAIGIFMQPVKAQTQQPADCLTVDWWNTYADAHDYKAVGVFSHAFVEAMKSVSANPMPPEMAAATKVAGWIGPSAAEVVLHFFDADGCDVGRWTFLTPEQLRAILARVGASI